MVRMFARIAIMVIKMVKMGTQIFRQVIERIEIIITIVRIASGFSVL